MSGIKNFSYTIPTIGRIAIGEKVEINGKKLPSKLDHFIITAQYQRDGRFVQHPAHEAIAKHTGQASDKIRSIPIKLMFDDPDLNVRERYEAFGADARMLCAGDGETARRMVAGKMEDVSCPGADHCEFGKAARCKLMTRLNVQIDVPETSSFKPDPLSTFILRSAGFNTARTIRAKLTALAAMLGNKLTGVPLKLQLRQKSSTLSYQSMFFYVDVVPAVSLIDAAKLAKGHADAMVAAGLNQQAFEEKVREGLSNGAFEDSSEDFLEAEEYLDSLETTGLHGEGQGDDSPAEGSLPPSTSAISNIEPDEHPLAWMGHVREQVGQLESMAH